MSAAIHSKSVRLRKIHLMVGLLALVAFLITGQIMDRQYAHLVGMPDGPRLLHRSAHIYLLLAASINVLLGLYLAPAGRAWRRGCQWAGSALLLAAPVLFLLAFFKEPWLQGLVRPYARPAIYGVLAAVGLHLAARIGERTDN